MAAALMFYARMALLLALSGCVTASALAQEAAVVDGSKRQEMTIWVKGTVRNAAGQPVSGAKVYLRAIYHGGIRSNAVVHAAVSEADGHYVIEGEKYFPSISAALVAYVPGHPPAFAWVQSEPNWDEPGFGRKELILPKGDSDFVIPAQGGSLEVLVTRNGQPAEGVEVALRLQGVDPFDDWGLAGQTNART